jgi:hypothetical protein
MPRALNQPGQINNALTVETRLEDVKIVDGFVERVINVIGDTALLFGRRLERGVRVDA